MNLESHPTKSALAGLLPDAHVSGGSFVEVLPDPDDFSPEERRRLLRTFRNKAVSSTVDELLQSIDARERSPLVKTPGGNRIWPDEYAGSVTHKEAVVLAALVPKRSARSIGIDIEINQIGGKGLSHTVNDEEIPPVDNDGLSVLSAFSSKEAVYKAYYPLKQQVLDFDDVCLRWEGSRGNTIFGVGECPESEIFDVQCAIDDCWVISTAQYDSRG